MYAAKLFEKHVTAKENNYHQYSSQLQKLLRPKCVCFYNGREKQPAKKILRLSDAFEGISDIEVRVTMLNVNYGKNKKLMETCKPLNEYAWLVETVREFQRSGMTLEEAVETAIKEMPKDYLIRKFLLSNKAEVKGMFLTEFDWDEVREQDRIENEMRGVQKTNERVARDMLMDGRPLVEIERYSKLTENIIRKIAKKLGIQVA